MAFPNGWKRKALITIPAANVAGTGGSHQAFPLLLTGANLPSEMLQSGSAGAAQNGGGDLRFSADENGAIPIPMEVVAFVTANDPIDAHAELWVKIPSLGQDTDTTIYVWWSTDESVSQPAVTDALGRNAVWSDYLRVFHLDDTTDGPFVDSAGNGNMVGTGTGGTFSLPSVPGRSGGAIEIEPGQEEWFDLAAVAPIAVPAGADLAAQAWLFPKEYSGNNPGFWRSGQSGSFANGGNFNIYQGDTGLPWVRWNGSNILKPSAGAALSLNQWSFTTFRSSSTARFSTFLIYRAES